MDNMNMDDEMNMADNMGQNMDNTGHNMGDHGAGKCLLIIDYHPQQKLILVL